MPCMMGASDVVYVEKRRGPRTDPWGTPVTNLCALDTSPPQATLKDRPSINEIFKKGTSV